MISLNTLCLESTVFALRKLFKFKAQRNLSRGRKNARYPFRPSLPDDGNFVRSSISGGTVDDDDDVMTKAMQWDLFAQKNEPEERKPFLLGPPSHCISCFLFTPLAGRRLRPADKYNGTHKGHTLQLLHVSMRCYYLLFFTSLHCSSWCRRSI